MGTVALFRKLRASCGNPAEAQIENALKCGAPSERRFVISPRNNARDKFQIIGRNGLNDYWPPCLAMHVLAGAAAQFGPGEAMVDLDRAFSAEDVEFKR